MLARGLCLCACLLMLVCLFTCLRWEAATLPPHPPTPTPTSPALSPPPRPRQDDLVCLPPKLAASMGNIGPLVLVTRVTNAITLTDPLTLRQGARVRQRAAGGVWWRARWGSEPVACPPDPAHPPLSRPCPVCVQR